MNSNTSQLPVFPLVLDGVPAGLRQALSQEGISCVERAQARAAGRFVLFDSRSGRCRGVAAGQIPLDVDALRRSAEGDPFEDLLDERSCQHGYRIGGFEFREEMASIDKRQVRRRLMTLLRQMIESRGGIWLKLSAYPFPYRSVFNLRTAYRQAEPDFEEVLADVAGYEGATSHYLCGQAIESTSAAARLFAGLDVGSLGYRAVIYDDTDENVSNLRLGISALRRLGLEPHGYAPPDERFSLPLLSALDVVGVTHSPTTALCYDELPLFANNCQVLQLPSHPLRVGRSGDCQGDAGGTPTNCSAAAAVEAVSEHFRALINARYRTGEPLLLHRAAAPRAVHARDAVAAVLAAAAGRSALWRTTLTQFAEWWRRRAATRLQVSIEAEHIQLTVDHRPADFRLAAEFWRGEHVALVPIDAQTTRLTLGALAFESRRASPLPMPQRVDRAEPLQRVGRKRSTAGAASEESHIRALRDWMTRTLRRPWE